MVGAPVNLGARPRILVVKLGAVGDCVHTLPAVKALRRRYPRAFIAWIIEPKSHDVICHHPELIDEIVVFERKEISRRLRKPWRFFGALRMLWNLARRMRRYKFDAAVDYQTLLKSGLITRLCGARVRVGFDKWRELNKLFTNVQIRPDENAKHAVDKYLSLSAALDVEPAYERVPIGFAEEDKKSIDGFLSDLNIENYLVINPGGSWSTKLWEPARYGETARVLYERLGLPAVVIYGPGENDLAMRVLEAAGQGAVLAPPTTLGELAYLLGRARLYVGADTGPTHIGVAMGTPVVSIYGPSEIARNGPYAGATIVRDESLDCLECWQRRCHKVAAGMTPPCLAGVSAAMVIEAAAEILDTTDVA